MCPIRTFQSWGNSSHPIFRIQRCRAFDVPDEGFIVLNLTTLNGLPESPTRSWINKGEIPLINNNSALKGQIQESKRTIARSAKTISNNRFKSTLDHSKRGSFL